MNQVPSPSAKLLLLDNDEAILELAAWFLRNKGYQVRTATSFVQARQRIREDWPDLFLSDIDLGLESGGEELPLLSQQGQLPPTLIVSGYLDTELAERLCALPQVRGTIVKPFDLPVLETRIESCLSESRSAAPPALPASRELSPAEFLERLRIDHAGWVEIQPLHPSGGNPRNVG